VRVDRLDHLVLTVASIEASVAFYTGVLGLAVVTFRGGRTALVFGSSKINPHEAGREFSSKALRPTPGSADLCFIVDDPLADVVRDLGSLIESEPVERTGAGGPILSVYRRDPDQNLIELSTPHLSTHADRM
jgi:catechol 2,3-dioxygenase-like lactoylglutathione lyase family enzyme